MLEELASNKPATAELLSYIRENAESLQKQDWRLSWNKEKFLAVRKEIFGTAANDSRFSIAGITVSPQESLS